MSYVLNNRVTIIDSITGLVFLKLSYVRGICTWLYIPRDEFRPDEDIPLPLPVILRDRIVKLGSQVFSTDWYGYDVIFCNVILEQKYLATLTIMGKLA